MTFMGSFPKPEQPPIPASPREEIVWRSIDELTVDMFVHPMTRSPFLLETEEDLAAIRDSGVKGIFVDLARSHLTPPKAPATASTPRLSVQERNAAKAREPWSPSQASAALRRASATLQKVQRPVEQLLDDVRLGRAVSSPTVRSVVSDIIGSVQNDGDALISLSRIRSKDRYTYAHSIAVCALMANLGKRLDLDQSAQRELAVGGLLHDVGKMLVPTAILSKPARLSPEEMKVMRDHPALGHDLLARNSSIPAVALDICLHHHERMDGSGYPDGLAAGQISLPARLAAICDVYDAMTGNRPYKAASAPGDCLASMFGWEGHFDPDLIAVFIRSVGIYPIGSLVRLATGHLGVVLAQNERDLTRPTVRVFYSIAKRASVPMHDLVLGAGNGAGDPVEAQEDPRDWGFYDWDRQWPRMLMS